MKKLLFVGCWIKLALIFFSCSFLGYCLHAQFRKCQNHYDGELVMENFYPQDLIAPDDFLNPFELMIDGDSNTPAEGKTDESENTTIVICQNGQCIQVDQKPSSPSSTIPPNTLNQDILHNNPNHNPKEELKLLETKNEGISV
jgi:hypothetical protein